VKINSFFKSLFRTKSIENIISDAKKSSLEKTLGALDLVFLGVGCTIGIGIFVLTGVAAAKYAGPAISISFALAAVICMFTALAYTELAALVPASGSAYTYSYLVLGEFIAWIVACTLIVEYIFGSAIVAAGWSGYFTGILKSGGINVPEYLTKAPVDGGLINLPAVLVTSFIGVLLIFGTKESMLVNRILVITKLVVIFLFLFIAAPHIRMENYAEFMPFGWNGVVTGAAMIFLAYAGFDAVSAAAEEVKNPNRDLPIGIIGSLIICALIYIAASLVLTGIVDYKTLNNSEPITYALRANGSNIGSALVGTGAVAGMLTVLLALMYGQSRILFVMSRDGLIPSIFSRLHKKFHTPHISSITVTIAIILISGFTPIKTLGQMTSLATLCVFAIVCLSVAILRFTRPDIKRSFKCPAVFIISPIAVLSCSYLIYTLILETGKPFFIWIAFSLIFYFFYSYKGSPLNKK
jgi:APA family basic amino acid/polyamine antiporter